MILPHMQYAKKRRAMAQEKANEPFFHYHSQNLTSERSGYGGRCWLTMGRKKKQSFHIEAYLGGNRCSAGFTIGDDETDLLVDLCLPKLFRLYIAWESGLLSRRMKNWFHQKSIYHGLTADIRVFDYTVWFNMLNDECGYADNKYHRSCNFDLRKLFLGKLKIEREEYRSGEIVISMPEGYYTGTYTITRITHKRNWYAKSTVFDSINVDIPDGIPHPGKGTTSYNCSDTALTGFSHPFTSFAATRKAIRDSVMHCRNNYPL